MLADAKGHGWDGPRSTQSHRDHRAHKFGDAIHGDGSDRRGARAAVAGESDHECLSQDRS